VYFTNLVECSLLCIFWEPYSVHSLLITNLIVVAGGKKSLASASPGNGCRYINLAGYALMPVYESSNAVYLSVAAITKHHSPGKQSITASAHNIVETVSADTTHYFLIVFQQPTSPFALVAKAIKHRSLTGVVLETPAITLSIKLR
jgi:hypothetical protein